MIDLNTAIRLNSKFISAYVWRGFCYKELGEKNLSLQDLTYAIQNKTKLVEEDSAMLYNAYIFRSQLYIHGLKNYELGIGDCNSMINIKPNDPYAFKNRGICYYYKGQFELSVKDLETSLKYDPKDEQTLYWLRSAVQERPLAPSAGPYTVEEIEKLFCMDRSQRKDYF